MPHGALRVHTFVAQGLYKLEWVFMPKDECELLSVCSQPLAPWPLFCMRVTRTPSNTHVCTYTHTHSLSLPLSLVLPVCPREGCGCDRRCDPPLLKLRRCRLLRSLLWRDMHTPYTCLHTRIRTRTHTHTRAHTHPTSISRSLCHCVLTCGLQVCQ